MDLSFLHPPNALISEIITNHSGFISRNCFYLWRPELIRLHIITDGLTGIAYYSMAIALIYLVNKRQEIVFSRTIILLSTFILICGTVHFMSIWTIGHPDYWLSGALKAIVALASIYIAIVLITEISRLITLPNLKIANQKLEQNTTDRHHIEETLLEPEPSQSPILTHLLGIILGIIQDVPDRKKNEETLRQLNNQLEPHVQDQSQDLSNLNQTLQIELEARRQAEQSLFEALQKLNFHVENSPLSVLEWDQSFHITRWSAAAETLFGWSAEEVLGKTLIELDFVFEDDRSLVRAVVEDLINGKVRQLTLTNRNYRRDGSVAYCEWYNSVLLDENDQIESILSLVIDVTDRYRIEQIKSEFISIVNHELRTPLTAIHGSLGMIASGLLDNNFTKQKRLLEIAIDSTDRLVHLINDILDIERIGTGNITLIRRKYWIPDLLKSAVNTVHSLLNQANIIIKVQTLEEWIEVDHDRIIQTLTNLICNAIKFSTSGQQIDLIVTQEEDGIVFQVCDRGQGIPSNQLERIFERFQQVDSSDARNYDGSGLGLAICRSIIQQHGGKIWAQSQPGKGSTFSFWLPRSINREESNQQVILDIIPDITLDRFLPITIPSLLLQENSKNQEMMTNPFNEAIGETHFPTDLKILLVEDDSNLAEVLTTSLSHHGITIVHTNTGSQAIQLTQEIIPDLIILDLILPDRDGFAVVDWLRQHQQLNQIPLMIYSAKDLELSEQQNLTLGQTDFVTKSRVTPHEFEVRVMSLLQTIG